MAQSNHERVGKALEILNKGLQPFIEREMQVVYGDRWLQEATANLRDYHLAVARGGELSGDTHVLLMIMWDQWHTVFKKVLGHTERSLVSELREIRNKWAHQEAFSTDDAYRALDSMQRLLIAISSAPQAHEIDRQKQELLRIRFDEQLRNETRKIAVSPIEGRPLVGLRPWREIITPQPDVASGSYKQAEFAADLVQVYYGEGSDEYRVPHDFFQRTYLTSGLRRLLSGALQRLSDTGGDPVIELQTNFGGGKTHSLLALYHLFSGAAISDLVGMESILQSTGLSRPPQAKRAVLVGHELSPSGQQRPKPDGCIINTMWGELAWQLMGKDGFAMVAEADRRGVSPGTEVLRDLFARVAPCLILIDEWVVYVRQLYGKNDLLGGSFDANLSFAQSLTEAAKAVPRTLLVASIPASDDEAGGEVGREALVRLKSIFGRLESPWRPADTEEGFEIVRRRLFQPIAEPGLYIARDNVAKAFADFYRGQSQEFPSECRETEYERRIKAAYPIHPELFDRLFNDWSSLEKFQRTRGVLRLMAAVVHTLWERQDASPLILPANMPIDEPSVQSELTYYLENTWIPVIEKDIDGPNSLSLRLDRENANLGRFSACRRVARTIYLGSAPTMNNPNKGLTDSQIKLGCVQPGESVATFGDALRRLTDQATHLYQNDKRYWYSTQPSVTRLAQDRAIQVDEETVFEEIEQRLKIEQNNRADFGRVHVCPNSSADIADDDHTVKLVLLKPKFSHAHKDQSSEARQEAAKMLDWRGNTRRNYRNTLIFLGADRTRLEELKQAVRQFKAWNSIDRESETLNLDAFQRGQTRTKLNDVHKRIEALLPETYIWLIVPDQPDPKKPDLLEEFKLQPQPLSTLVMNALRRLRSDDLLITQYAGTLLRRELDRIPLWRGDNVGIKTLAEDFARYVYLPRLKNTDVLLDAVHNGVQSLVWQQETFAYADSWDTQRNRYMGLKAGQHITAALNNNAVLVKSEVATAQMAADAEAAVKSTPLVDTITYTGMPAHGSSTVNERPESATMEPSFVHMELTEPEIPAWSAQAVIRTGEPQYRRFHGSVNINPRMMASDAGKIMDEVVKHLTTILSANVQVTLEIQGNIPSGVPDETSRAVMENCRKLKFGDFGFEEE